MDSTSCCFQTLQELMPCPVLNIIDQEDHMHSSVGGGYHLVESGIRGWRAIHCVGGEPKVLLRIVDHPPCGFEEFVPG